jgi:hypothetical protein
MLINQHLICLLGLATTDTDIRQDGRRRRTRRHIDRAHRTQVWVAMSDAPGATVSRKYFFHQRLKNPDSATNDIELQERLLDSCRKVSGLNLVGRVP